VAVSETYRAKGMYSQVLQDMHDALIFDVAHEEWDDALRLEGIIMSSIAPADITERTNPAIRWGAQRDFEENQDKWGSQQRHPVQ
jgi:hypothetical protein